MFGLIERKMQRVEKYEYLHLQIRLMVILLGEYLFFKGDAE